MEMFNLWNVHFLLSFGLVLVVVLIFFYIAAKKQDRALSKVDESLKRQEQANKQLNLIVNELRRSNRLLGELAGMEYVEETAESNSSETPSMPSDISSALDIQHKLYVGNIDYSATESELASYFSPYGQVEFVNIPVNRYTNKARGFGFVTFVSKDDAKRAMALHDTEFKGRKIQVNFAKERDLAR